MGSIKGQQYNSPENQMLGVQTETNGNMGWKTKRRKDFSQTTDNGKKYAHTTTLVLAIRNFH